MIRVENLSILLLNQLKKSGWANIHHKLAGSILDM